MLDTIIYIPTILAYAFITLLVVILSFIVVYVSHKIYISVHDNLPVPGLDSSSILDDSKSTEKTEAVVSERSSANSILTKQAQIVRKTTTALKIIVTLQPCYLAYVVFETRKTANIIVPAPTARASLTISETVSPKVTPPATDTELAPITATPTTTATVSVTPPTTTTMSSTHTIMSSCNCVDCNGDKPDNTHDTNDSNDNSSKVTHQKEEPRLSDATYPVLGKNKYIKYYDRLANIPHGKIMQTCPHPVTELRRPDMGLLSSVYDSIQQRRMHSKR